MEPKEMSSETNLSRRSVWRMKACRKLQKNGKLAMFRLLQILLSFQTCGKWVWWTGQTQNWCQLGTTDFIVCLFVFEFRSMLFSLNHKIQPIFYLMKGPRPIWKWFLFRATWEMDPILAIGIFPSLSSNLPPRFMIKCKNMHT